MTDELGTSWATAWVEAAAADVMTARTELIELDRAIGDGDHGENLSRGLAAAATAVGDGTPISVKEVFAVTAKTLMSTVGGASGPLYGSVFIGAAKCATLPLDGAGVATMLESALESLMKRGKAHAGEKTMVDAWTPAVEAAKAAADAGAGPAETLSAAADAAAAGALATEPLIATKGRASYLGERSRGHRDPGAQSTAIILAAAATTAASRG